jgi:outer membrane lipoprotein-sorting protein
MYAKITLIYIQTETNLPVSIKVMDNEGMYEQFELRDIKINKGFAKNEFTKDFLSYSFK